MCVPRREVVIVGSGFAGAILARILRQRGRDVLLLERDHHPRFALGESATPLAALALERIAREHDLPDLADLAAYHRWSERLPGLGRGLKRGFSFYRHAPGRPFANGEEDEARLLVAASPEDRLADAHWLRADVDRHLAYRARDEGVELWEGAEACGLRAEVEGVEVEGLREGVPFRVLAEAVVDATGAGSFLARALLLASSVGTMEPDSQILGGHFRGVRSFVEAAGRGGASFGGAPYPEERAAVHHLLEEGWMYVLPFDDGVVSAGMVLDNHHPAVAALGGGSPEELFRRVLARYPTLDESFARAKPVRPMVRAPRIQRRLARAAGDRWLLLPHAFGFVDPLFSTGIAWSLLGVERAARILGGELPPSPAAMEEYDALLQTETAQVERLIAGALRAARSFPLFVAWSFLYFAFVLWDETRQRLGIEAPGAFLGADRGERRDLLAEARRRLETALELGSPAAARDFEGWIRSRIAPFDLGGFSDPDRGHLFPVDLDLLVERAPLLGLSREAMRAALPDILRA